MDDIYPHCFGIDRRHRTLVACLLCSSVNSPPTQEVQSFGAITGDLLRLADGLATVSCTHVAMESTGISYKLLENLLEGAFAMLVVNARHIKHVPGRKADVREWRMDR